MAKNQQYLDSLIFTLNHGYQDMMAGVELSRPESYFTADRTREILQTVVNASKLGGKVERRLAMKKHIKEIIYSKEAIEVILFYGANDSPAFVNSSEEKGARASLDSARDKQNHNTAAFFCPHPKKCRRGSVSEKIIDEQKNRDEKNGTELVCDEKMVGVVGIEPTTSSV